MKDSIKSSLLFILLLTCSLIGNAQRVDYKGGYFKKSGNTWYEYRPQEKSGVHNYFQEVDSQEKFWILDNGACKVALPKNSSATTIWIKLPGKEWEYKYTATGVSHGTSKPAASSKPKASTGASTSSSRTTAKSTSSRSSANSSNGRIKCEQCNGTGTSVCPSCGGKGIRNTCVLCNGSGRSFYGTACTMCGGEGYTKCIYCGNKGKRKCMLCNGRGWYNEATLRADEEAGRQLSEEAKRLRQQQAEQRQKTRQQSNQRHVCSVCGGTGIGNTDDRVTPDGIAPSNIKHVNRAGDLCPYCGSRRYHAHFKCGGCRGTGR